jgi:hypothetical protein
LRKYIKFIILFLLAAFILWFFGQGLNWNEVTRSLHEANLVEVGLATLLICLGYLLRAFRWRTLLAPITETKIKDLFATTTIGFAAVFLFGRAGELVRPMWLPLRDKRVRPTAALVTIGLERICDLTAIVVLFSLNLLWFQAPAGRENEFVYVRQYGIILLVCAIAGIVSLAIFQRFSYSLINFFEPWLKSRTFLPKILIRIILSLMKNLAASLEVVKSVFAFAMTVFWTACLWLAIAIPTYLVIHAFGLPLSFSDSLFVMGFSVVGSLVPTPGGAAGAFHAATAAGLIFLNVNRDEAAAVSIVMHLVYFAPALIFGFYYFLHGDITWQRFRNLVIPDDAAESKLQFE